jgi:hypothetical protein
MRRRPRVKNNITTISAATASLLVPAQVTQYQHSRRGGPEIG